MITTILFDLGGVLVQLRSEEHLRSLNGETFSLERFWRLWSDSPAVRAHETGKIDADEFARRIVTELGLTIAPTDFLDGFRRWIVGPYDETAGLIAHCHSQFTTALLTNTSALHWSTIESFNILPFMHHIHASFQVGLIKPDQDYFVTALEKTGAQAAEALFFDDSPINIAAAQSLGIEACQVNGAAQVWDALRARGLAS